MSLKGHWPRISRQAIEVFVLLAAAVVPCLLSVGFDDGTFFFGGDSRLPELNLQANLTRDWFVWKSAYDALGSPDVTSLALVPEDLVKSLLLWLGMSAGYVHRLVPLFYLSVTGLSMYVLVRVLLPEYSYAAFLGGIVYLFNFFRLTIVGTFQVTFITSYALAPFLMALVIQGARRQGKRALLLFILLSWLNLSSAENTAIILIQSALLIFSAFLALLTAQDRRTVARYTCIYGLIFVGINAAWWLPLANWVLSGAASMRSSTVLSSWAEFNSRAITSGNSLLNMFRMLSPAYFQPPYIPDTFQRYLTSPLLTILSYSVPFLATTSLLFFRKASSYDRKLVLSFLLVLILSLLLVGGAKVPGLSKVQKLVLSLPLLKMLLRNVFTKVGMILPIAASFLTAWAVAQLPLRDRSRKWVVFGLAAVLSGSFSTYWNGNFLNVQYKVAIPPSYARIAEHLNQDPAQSRVLELPYFESNNFKSYTWGYSGAYGVLPLMLERPVMTNMQGEPSERGPSEAIYTNDKPLLQSLLFLFNIRDVIYHKDADILRLNESIPLQQIESVLARPPFVLEQDTGELQLYGVEQPHLEHVYAAERVTLVGGRLFDFGRVFDVAQPSSQDAFLFADDGHSMVPPTNQFHVNAVDDIVSVSYPELLPGGELVHRVPISVTGTFSVYVRSAIPATLVFSQGVTLTAAASEQFAEIGQVQLKGADSHFHIESPRLAADQSALVGKGEWAINGCQESRVEVLDNGTVYLALKSHYKSNFGYNCYAARVLPATPGEEYLLDFDYKYESGSPPRLTVDHMGEGVAAYPSQPLLPYFATSEVWHRYSTIVKSRVTDEWILFSFSADPPYDQGEVTRSQYQVRLARLEPVEVVFRSVLPARQRHTPELTYAQISPIQYKVTVHDATEPFLLVLSESFDPGWRAIVGDGVRVDESNHIQVNYYANGWWIDRTGDFTVTIRHTTQDYVLAGLIVALTVSAISVGCIVIMRRGGRLE